MDKSVTDLCARNNRMRQAHSARLLVLSPVSKTSKYCAMFLLIVKDFHGLKKGFQSSQTFKALKAFKAHRLSKGLSKLTLSNGAFKLSDFQRGFQAHRLLRP